MPVEKLTKAILLTDKSNFNEVVSRLISFRLFHVSENLQERNEEIEEYVQTLSRMSAELDNLANELGIKREYGVMDYLFNRVQIKTYDFEFENFRSLINELKTKLNSLSSYLAPMLEEKRNLSKKIEEMSKKRRNLELISKLGIDLSLLKHIKRHNAVLALINRKTLLELKRSLTEDIYISEEKIDEENYVILLVSRTEQAEKISRILAGLEIQQIGPIEEFESIEESLNKLSKEIEEVKLKISELELKISYEAKKNYYDILALYEIVSIQYLNVMNLKISKPLKNFLVIEGYIPVRFSSYFSGLMKDVALVDFEEVKGKDLPSLIVNKPGIKAFENITFMQGPAGYHEIEPTLFVFFFFSLFYGFMYADLGGGLLIISLGLFLYLKATGGLKQWGVLLVTIGISSSIFGVLHNEFFGFNVPLIKYEPLFELVDHATGSLNPEGVILMLQLSIVIGIIHLILGMVLRLFNGLKSGNKEDIMLAISYLTFYISGVFLLYGLLIFNINAGAFSSSPEPIFGIPAYIYSRLFSFLALLGLILLLLSRYIAHRLSGHENIDAKALLSEGALEVFDTIPRLLSNTISYVRLAILVIVHSIFLLYIKSAVMLSIGNPIITTLVVGIVLVLGNLGIALMEGFIVFIQALRLHLYEWFTKFYYGEGRPFRAFYTEGIFSRIKFSSKEKHFPD